MRRLSQGVSPHQTGKPLEAGARGTPVLRPPGAGTQEILHICPKNEIGGWKREGPEPSLGARKGPEGPGRCDRLGEWLGVGQVNTCQGDREKGAVTGAPRAPVTAAGGGLESSRASERKPRAPGGRLCPEQRDVGSEERTLTRVLHLHGALTGVGSETGA